MGKLLTALPAAIGALAGVGLYFLGDGISVPLAIIVDVLVIALGYALLRSGRYVLEKRPVLGVGLMTGWIIGVIGIGAGVTAGLVGIAVLVADAVSSLSKDQADAMGSAVTGAITTLAATVFTDDLDKGTGDIWPSAMTRKAMSNRFKDVFPSGSRAFEAVYEDRVSGSPPIDGWGLRARLRRAKVVEDAL